MLQLRPARPDEAQALSDLCMMSKAYWGYDEMFMEACRKELTISAQDFETSQIAVAEGGGRLAGITQLKVDGGKAELDKLYVHPDFMGAGAGRILFEWAVSEARTAGAAFMTVDADPNAADFYRRMGARDDGRAPSDSIPGRFLPRLRFDLRNI